MEEKCGGLIVWFDKEINSEIFDSKVKNISGLKEILLKGFNEFFIDIRTFDSVKEFDVQILTRKEILFSCIICQEEHHQEVVKSFEDFPVVKNILVFLQNNKKRYEIMKSSHKVGLVSDITGLSVNILKVLRNQLNLHKYGRRRSSCWIMGNPYYDEAGNNKGNSHSDSNNFLTFSDIASDSPKVYFQTNKLTDDDGVDYYLSKEKVEGSEKQRAIAEELFSNLNINLNIELYPQTFKKLILETFKDRTLFTQNDNILDSFLKELRLAKDLKEISKSLLSLYSNTKNLALYRVINSSIKNFDLDKINRLRFIIVGILMNFRKDFGYYKYFKSMCKYTNMKEFNHFSPNDLVFIFQMAQGFSNKNYARSIYSDKISKQSKAPSKKGANVFSSDTVYLKFFFEKETTDPHFHPYIVMMDNLNNNRFKIIHFPLAKFLVKKVKLDVKNNIFKVKLKTFSFFPIIKLSTQNIFQLTLGNSIRDFTIDQVKSKGEKEITKLENSRKNVMGYSSALQSVLTSIILTNIGILYEIMRETNDSLHYLEEASKQKKYFFQVESDENGFLYYLIAKLHLKKGELNISTEKALKGLEVYSNLSPNSEEAELMMADLLDLIGLSYDISNNYNKAIENYLPALEIKTKIFGSSHFLLIKTLNNLGCICYKNLNYDKALEYFEKASSIASQFYQDNSYETLISANNIATVNFCMDSKLKAKETCDFLIKNIK